MKLKFEVKEVSSFFHILDSISLWSIHARNSIDEYYKDKYGFTKEDKKFIEEYILIREKYGWKKLDSDFYPAKNFKDAYTRIKKRLNKKEYEKLVEIIEYYRPKIKKMFLEFKPYLELRKKRLEKEVKKHNLKQLFKEVADFYEAKDYSQTVIVHLVVNPSTMRSGGGANISPRNHITVEPRNLKGKNKQYLLHDISTIAHETLHLIETKANKKKWDNFRKLVKNKKLNMSILREAIADSLIPYGYLALKYNFINEVKIIKYKKIKSISKYRKTNASKYYGDSRKKLSAMIYPLTKKQMEENKGLFGGGYIENCINQYLEMRKTT